MVLKSRRIVSNVENAPPGLSAAPAHGKSLASRLRSSFRDPARQRRARAARASKNQAENARRKGKGKGSGGANGSGKASASAAKPAATMEFDITAVAAPPESADVEMADADPAPQLARTTKRYVLPRELRRPPFKEVSAETLLSFEPELGDGESSDLPDLEYIRDIMEEMGPGLLRAALSVDIAAPENGLPKQIAITLKDTGSDYPPPTHMLALYRPVAKDAPTARRHVTLVPTHSVVLALHCALLPPFTLRAAAPEYAPADSTGAQLTVPVQPLGLPAPPAFAPLAAFLYTKRADQLLKALLPAPPPAALGSGSGSGSDTERRGFAARLAATYTGQALMDHALRVYGLWQNACVLGVHVDELWDAVALAWDVLLAALAFSTSQEHLVLNRPPSDPTSAHATATPAPEPDPALAREPDAL
ncbi:hypothetical protein GGX14DRAFT_604878 [Mycena pura]|uniref:Uncharacterized protein n=1 Tax=Mycena pura TaxID=153505 RepID=A0AAD6VLJ4_9AGAR|nr:hypothetical protein GGX14DRAFT_604878 [Mycena pura]